MELYGLFIVIHYTTTINGAEWHGSNAGNSPTLYIMASTKDDAIRKVEQSLLIASVGSELSPGTVVTKVEIFASLVDANHLIK
jgi:hypothetical protein